MENEVISTEDTIKSKILVIRGQQVMIDRDLAQIYGVETKRLNQQVKRNIERFPADFMIELTREEYNSLRCQNGTIENGRGEHSGTPIDLQRFVKINKPCVKVGYELQEIGQPDLKGILDDFIAKYVKK